MSTREYIRLDHAQPAGALILTDRASRVIQVDCDLCGETFPKWADWQLRMDVTGAGHQVHMQFEVCTGCLLTLPGPILAKLGEYGLQVPGGEDLAMTPSRP